MASSQQLPTPDITDALADDDIRRYWCLDVDDVRAVTVSTAVTGFVDVRVERGSSHGTATGRWGGVHARTGVLTPDDAERLGRCLLAAAADARTRTRPMTAAEEVHRPVRNS